MGVSSSSDAELIHRYRRGDVAAFEVLVGRYTRLAGAIAYNVLGDYAAAADAVQEAFLKVHESAADLREPERFKSWLYGVVRTCALDAVRRRRRRPATSLTALDGAENEVVDAGLSEPAAGLERQEVERAVLDAVRELPESYREVVVLKYLDERSYKEIAEILGITIETIESRLFRARRLLKTKLAQYAGAPGADE